MDLRQRQPETAFPPAEISDSDWEATPPSVRALLEHLTAQLEALAAHFAQLEEQKARSSRNSSNAPYSDGPSFKPRDKEKGTGSGRKRGAKEGHPGHGRDLHPAEKCKEVIPHRPMVCSDCGATLAGGVPGVGGGRADVLAGALLRGAGRERLRERRL